MRIGLTAILWLTCAAAAPADDRGAEEFFETKVRPVLAERCFGCHGDKKQQAGLRLDSREAMLKGGDSGPAIVPGDPAKSLVVQVTRYDGDTKMPPKEPLAAEQRTALAEWIKLGAPWPAIKTAATTVDAKTTHWAFQPVPPSIGNRKSEIGNPIDALVATKLAAKRLNLNPPADPTTLIRRLALDLHGLPPTPAEVEAFLRDDSPEAVAKLIERLLASPRYGERWGRHWLNLARYADTKGYLFEEERRYPFAYTYRDYVIRSFNEDKPYDRFIIEQLAADLLPPSEDKKPLAALGFLTVGRRFLNNVHDIIDDRIDVVSRGFMGLTVACARCHDHKYDPIPAADYYSLYGVFASTNEPKDLPTIETPQRTVELTAYETELAKREGAARDFLKSREFLFNNLARLGLIDAGPIQAASAVAMKLPAVPPEKLKKAISRADRTAHNALTAKIELLKATSPAAPARAMIVADNATPTNPYIFLRGNAANHGPTVPRQFPAIVSTDRKPFAKGSGRLELAQAIADPKNPLTARVLVNRVWQHHFGRGLVDTPSDFGVRSDPPANPELLDYLASEFVKHGWSIKHLQRLILTSKTYGQSSADRPEAIAIDPENRLTWKFNRQRLELEPLRDSMLAASGLLDGKLGGPAIDILKEPFLPRRTVYGHIDRQNLPGLFRTFDFAGPDTHSPQRFVTTVPQQALFLMNSPFAGHVAKALANRADVLILERPEDRIDALYRLLFARKPSLDESESGMRFVADGSPEAWVQYCQALLLTNEFAFVD